jgi:hypothetical protein
MQLDLYSEFTALVSEFDRAGVDYAVVGGLALAIHGAPRATKDIDILVDPAQLERALEAAAGCGFRFKAQPQRFRASGIELQRVTKVVGEDHLTLDLLLVGPSLEAVWASRSSYPSTAGPVSVISRAGLIAMKSAAGRDQDLVDIDRLRDGDDG